MQIHVVRRGDTLHSISRTYNININQLIALNQLTNPEQLVVGQTLLIPQPETNTHLVKSGDTLFGIAKMHGTTVDALMADNRLSNPDVIYVGQVLKISKPIIDVNGYLAQGGATAERIGRQLGDYMTYICSFSYHILSNGGLTTFDDAALLLAEKEKRVTPLMTITNFAGRKFSSELAHTVLNSTQVQDTLLNNVVTIMKNKGYWGLNIDFEYVLPEDREPYNQFLRRTVNKLHPLGYSVSSALAPKNRADQVGLLYEAHDYPVHGALCDFVVLMTYEWGYAAGPPWAIAPINEVRRILDYAVTAIPRNKILMGMPTYGRDWKLPFVAGTSIAATISPPTAVERAYKYRADIKYNALYQSPYYNYTDEQGIKHEVWFEDMRSMQVKYNVVKAYKLRGVSFWELSTNFPQNWPLLVSNFQVRKLY